MAWTGSITLDNDKDDVGVLSLVWNEGQSDAFLYSARCKMDTRGIVEVAKRAMAAKRESEQRAAKTEALLGRVLAKMNAVG